MSLKHTDGRYILMLLDTKMKEHDGMIFSTYQDAQEYADMCLDEKYCDKAVIGFFAMGPHERTSPISMIETIGFKGDQKRVAQLKLFHTGK